MDFFFLFFFWKKKYHINSNVKCMFRLFVTIPNLNFGTKDTFLFSHESDNTMLFPMIFILLIRIIGIPFTQFNPKFNPK